jgi:hypothetical protein
MKIRLRWLGLGILGLVAVGCGSSIVGGVTGGTGGSGAASSSTLNPSGGSTATYVTCGSSMDPIFQPDGCPEGTANECCLPDGCCCQCPQDWTSSGVGGSSGGAGGGSGGVGGAGGDGPADAGAD